MTSRENLAEYSAITYHADFVIERIIILSDILSFVLHNAEHDDSNRAILQYAQSKLVGLSGAMVSIQNNAIALHSIANPAESDLPF